MKIAHITWSMTTGGIETMLVDIVNEQMKSCEVRVFVVNDYYDIDLLDRIGKKVKVTLLKRKSGGKNLWPIIRLNLLLLQYHPDVIHCHVANLASIIRVPFKKVLTIHNTHSSSEYFGKYDRLFCISNAVKEVTVQQGFPDVTVVYNGIHTNDIAVKDFLCSSDSGIKRIVCVGRLHKDKGQRVLLEAANELVNNRKRTNFFIELIGDGEDRESLEKLVDEQGIRLYVSFVGKKPRSWFYPRLKDYDLFVMPSISEGFGLTLAEACSAKLPVLTCDLSGPVEVIDGGRLGDTFKTGDAIALADGIENFLSSEVRVNQINAAYEYVKKNFDVVMTAQRYVEEYENLKK
ncbi:MAG: glycosyltransferase [Bacteroidales bacterium]|nr:glycosyltransferase [Bacteroidales bacterium]